LRQPVDFADWLGDFSQVVQIATKTVNVLQGLNALLKFLDFAEMRDTPRAGF
jgi:hypothetical protein